MLWILVCVILFLWLIGFSMSVVGDVVHVLLLIALAVVAYQLITWGRVGD